MPEVLEQELKLSVEGAFAPTLPPAGTRRRRHRGAARARPARHLLRHARPAARPARRHAAQPHRREARTPAGRVKLPVGDGIAEGRDEVSFGGGGRAVPPAAADLVRAFVRSVQPHAGGAPAHAPAPLAPAGPGRDRARRARRRPRLGAPAGARGGPLPRDRDRGPRHRPRRARADRRHRGARRRRARRADPEARAGARARARPRRPTWSCPPRIRPRDPAGGGGARRDRARRAADRPERRAHPARRGGAAAPDARRAPAGCAATCARSASLLDPEWAHDAARRAEAGSAPRSATCATST